MELKNLNSAIDKHLGPFCDEEIRKGILSAALLDFEYGIPVRTIVSEDVDKEWIFETYNRIFNRRCRAASDAVLKKYKKVFANFTKAEVEIAMNAAKQDDFHKQTKYKHTTIEYFSRLDQIDKWVNIAADKFDNDNGFVLPKFNVKGG